MLTQILGHIQSLIEKLQNPRFCQHIKNWLCAEELTDLYTCKANYFDLDQKHSKMNIKLQEFADKVESQKGTITYLHNQLVEALDNYPPDYQRIANNLNEKHPRKDVKYNLIIETAEKDIIKNIPVQNFIFSFYEIAQELHENGLTVDYYQAQNTNMSYGEMINELAFDIYKFTRGKVKYQYDQETYGHFEKWQTPDLTYWLGIGDCEDSSVLLASYFLAAGIPSFCWRVTAGQSKLGGHATVYMYDFNTQTWRHLEATDNKPKATKFNELPDKNNKDDLWIDDIWFSFTEKYAYNKFETSAARNTKPKKFIISRS